MVSEKNLLGRSLDLLVKQPIHQTGPPSTPLALLQKARLGLSCYLSDRLSPVAERTYELLTELSVRKVENHEHR